MPLKKIRSLPVDRPCLDPEHNPPTMIVLEPGEYEYECPRCGHKQRFIVPHGPTL